MKLRHTQYLPLCSLRLFRQAGLFCLALLVVGAVSVGCGVSCGTMALKYKLSSECLQEGGASGECSVEQNECTIVLQCGDILPHCRGYMIGSEVNLSCTLSDQRSSQVLADPDHNGNFRLLVLQKNSCKVQLSPLASGS